MKIRRIIPILFTLLIGLRGANVGQDTGVYYQHFYLFGERGCDFVEPGFDWINRFCYHMGWESWTMFLICAALAVFPAYLTLNKLNRKEYTIAAMFFYCCSFATIANGMRQAVACGIFLYLMSFYFDKTTFTIKELLIYVLGIGLASLMHASILLLIPMILLNKVPANKYLYSIVYLISFAFIYVDASSILPSVSFGNRDYSGYLEDIKFGQASSLGFIATTMLKLLILLCMFKLDTFKKHRVLSHFVMFSCILGNIGFNIPIIGRLNMYFSWFTYVVIAKMYVESKGRDYLSRIWRIIFACYLVLTLNGILSSANKLTPYTLYWQNNNYNNYLYYNE